MRTTTSADLIDNLSLTQSSDAIENSSPSPVPGSKNGLGIDASGFVMAPLDGNPGKGKSVLIEEPDVSTWDRAVRHNMRLPMRYRLEGQQEWRRGETINISESGLLFATDEMLEVNARIEITFQILGVPLLPSSSRRVLVVRRTLSNWPETKLIFGARFRH